MLVVVSKLKYWLPFGDSTQRVTKIWGTKVHVDVHPNFLSPQTFLLKGYRCHCSHDCLHQCYHFGIVGCIHRGMEGHYWSDDDLRYRCFPTNLGPIRWVMFNRSVPRASVILQIWDCHVNMFDSIGANRRISVEFASIHCHILATVDSCLPFHSARGTDLHGSSGGAQCYYTQADWK